MLRLLLGVWLSVVFIAVATPARAAAPPVNVPSAAQGLEISPPVLELNADPGQTLTVQIRLRDVSSGPLVVRATADDFGAKGENGDPQILLDEKEATRYSLKFWVQQPSSFTLVPQEVKTIPVRIVVPANAEPGGHYGVIRFTGTPPELDGTGVSLTASIGALVLLRVSGDITEKLEVQEFFTSKTHEKASFFETGPIGFTERLRNEGSVHAKPVGYVAVYNIFHKRVAQLAVSNPARNVLPDSIRKFEQQLETKRLFGRYTAQMNVRYGDNKKLSSKTISFWVIPYKLILAVIIAIVLLVFLLRQGLRRYNQWVINQASQRR
ncbi:MAG TPA: hypothetical protein VF272_04040 [Candidatus Saccharimonadia bacterium]